MKSLLRITSGLVLALGLGACSGSSSSPSAEQKLPGGTNDAPPVGESYDGIAPAGSNANITASTVPTTMTPNELVQVTVSVTNNGTVNWTNDGSFMLHWVPGTQYFGWADTFVNPATPASAATTFTFPIRAPSTAGTYHFVAQMSSYVTGQQGFFGNRLDVTVTVGAGQLALNDSFVSANFPSSMAAGGTANVTVVLQNTGTQAWDNTGGFYLYSKDNPTNLWGTPNYKPTTAVAATAQGTFDLTLKAPTTLGPNSTSWQMYATNVGFFGPVFTFNITVGAAPPDAGVVDSGPPDAGFSLPTITTASLPNGTIGILYSQTLQASGGMAPYTWSTVAPGALPPGLTLNGSTGQISGTPTAVGPFSFTAQVKDNLGQTSQKGFSITIDSDQCVSWGDTHITTLDGLHYDFQQVGEWVFARDVTTAPNIDVTVRQAPLAGSRKVAGNTAVGFKVGTDRVQVSLTFPGHSTLLNGGALSNATAALPGGAGIVTDSASAVSVTLPTGEFLKVNVYSDHLDFTLGLLHARRTHTVGLCGPDTAGTDGSNIAGDFTKRDGTVLPQPLSTAQLYSSFGQSWRVLPNSQSTDSQLFYPAGTNTGTFTDFSFPSVQVTVNTLSSTCSAAARTTCQTAGVTDATLLDACIVDVCVTGNNSYATNTNNISVPPATVATGPVLTTCSSWGDTHITTFDGLHYDFQQVGQWIALTTADTLFQVQARQEPFNGSSTTLAGNTMVSARYAGGPAVQISADGTVRVNGTVATLPATLGTSGQVVGGSGLFSVLWVDGDRLDVQTHGGHLDYQVGVRSVWLNQIEGLCGNYVGIVQDEFKQRNGTLTPFPPSTQQIYTDFGGSWRLVAGDPTLMFYTAGQGISSFDNSAFPSALVTSGSLTMAQFTAGQTACQNAGVVQPDLLDACIIDVGSTNNTALAQESNSVPMPPAGSMSQYAISGSLALTEVTTMVFAPDTAANSGQFDLASTAVPLFTLKLPGINLNPPGGTVGNFATDLTNNRPMVAVTTDVNTNYTGQVVIQSADGTNQAGVGAITNYDVVLETNLIVNAPGPYPQNIELDIYSDDGFVMGIGNGATYVSGPLNIAPALNPTAFMGLPVVGASNNEQGPTASPVVISFPAAGTYPLEVDYNECCGGQLAITLGSPAVGGHVIPPIAVIALTPNTDQVITHGVATTFSVNMTNGSGNPLANSPVVFHFTGANVANVSATTNTLGNASISFAGANIGTGSLQVSGALGGLPTDSNSIAITWQ
jgi:hypothetical protein